MVTISIPLYNTQEWISRAILSVFNQTYQDFELLLIDDCGNDDTIKIAEQLIANHKLGYKARIISHSCNKSLGTVRNTSIDEAKGNYILFLDGDDELVPTCLETLVSYVTLHPYDFVAGSAECRSNDGIVDKISTIYNGYNLKDIELLNQDKIVDETLIQCNIYIPIWNKLYSLTFLRNNNIRAIDGIYNEDEFFSLQVYLCAKSCKFISTVTAYHYLYKKKQRYGYTLCNQLQERKIRDYMLITKYEREFLTHYKNRSFYWEIVWRLYLLHYGEFCRRIKKHPELPKELRSEAIRYLSALPVRRIEILTAFPKSLVFLCRYIVYSIFPNRYRIKIPQLP